MAVALLRIVTAYAVGSGWVIISSQAWRRFTSWEAVDWNRSRGEEESSVCDGDRGQSLGAGTIGFSRALVVLICSTVS